VPPPAPARRSVIITEADMARGFIPYEEPRQWTVDTNWAQTQHLCHQPPTRM
jgi:hypothetical protein